MLHEDTLQEEINKKNVRGYVWSWTCWHLASWIGSEPSCVAARGSLEIIVGGYGHKTACLLQEGKLNVTDVNPLVTNAKRIQNENAWYMVSRVYWENLRNDSAAVGSPLGEASRPSIICRAGKPQWTAANVYLNPELCHHPDNVKAVLRRILVVLLIDYQTDIIAGDFNQGGRQTKKRRRVRHNTWSGGWPKKGWYTSEWSSK
jgi:hypothetical protein